MVSRPFRFGVQAFSAASGQEWLETVRRAEWLGYSTLFSCDHYFGPGRVAEQSGHRPIELGPIVAISMAAAATTTLRVGCRVICCDFHHPVVLAKELATLDMLSSGRLEIGLGAGWTAAEYQGLGIDMDRPGVRIARLGEYVDLLRAHFGGEQIDFRGTYINVTGFAGRPLPAGPPPPIMIGGGSPRILRMAGAKADVVSLNYDNSSGKLGPEGFASSGLEPTIRKLEWIREGAGDRFDDIEIEIGLYGIAVMDRTGSGAVEIAERFGIAVDDLADNPHIAVGSVESICDQLVERRERLGISYVTVAQRNMDVFAPVVSRLSGS